MNTVAIGTQVLITLDRHCFQGDTGTIVAAEKSPFGIQYDVEFVDGGSLYYTRNQFVIYQEAIDQGKFPAAHPRETLCAEYADFCDKVNAAQELEYICPNERGTVEEQLAEALRQNAMLQAINHGQNQKIYALEQRLNPKRAAQPWKAM